MASVLKEHIKNGEVYYTDTDEFASIEELEKYRNRLFEVAEELFGAFACETDGSVTLVRISDEHTNRYTFTY